MLRFASSLSPLPGFKLAYWPGISIWWNPKHKTPVSNSQEARFSLYMRTLTEEILRWTDHVPDGFLVNLLPTQKAFQFFPDILIGSLIATETTGGFTYNSFTKLPSMGCLCRWLNSFTLHGYFSVRWPTCLTWARVLGCTLLGACGLRLLHNTCVIPSFVSSF